MRLLLGAIVCFTVQHHALASLPVSFQTVALANEAAPGTNSTNFHWFNAPVIDSSGQTAFTAALNVSALEDFGVWSEAGGSLHLVARGYHAAPSFDGELLHGFDEPILAAGHTVIRGYITGSANDAYYRSDNNGSLAVLVRTGTTAPGANNASFSSLSSNYAVNSDGRVAFEGSLAGLGVTGFNSSGIWSDGSGSLNLIARQGDAPPGIDGGVFWDFRNVQISRDGKVAFLGCYTTTNPSSCSTAVFAERDNGLALVVRGGDIAPGTETAIFTPNFNTLRSNATGDVAFINSLTDPGGNDNNNEGIWSERDGVLSAVAREDEVAPGTQGAVFGSNFNTIAFTGLTINGAGTTAFNGRLRGLNVTRENYDAIWRHSDGDLGLIARGGDLAPGTKGAKFLGFNAPLLNEAGQIAFAAAIDSFGDQFDGRVGSGIWSTTPNGDLQLVVQTGVLFDVNDNSNLVDLRTISSIVLVGNPGSEGEIRASFNDAGQLAFLLRFTDGTEGVFVATFVPEPSTLGLMLLAASGLLFSRRYSAGREPLVQR